MRSLMTMTLSWTMEKLLDFGTGIPGLESTCQGYQGEPRVEIGLDECSQELKGRCAVRSLRKSLKKLIHSTP